GGGRFQGSFLPGHFFERQEIRSRRTPRLSRRLETSCRGGGPQLDVAPPHIPKPSRPAFGKEREIWHGIPGAFSWRRRARAARFRLGGEIRAGGHSLSRWLPSGHARSATLQTAGGERFLCRPACGTDAGGGH